MNVSRFDIYCGYYQLENIVIHVFKMQNDLVVGFPGVPAGFEVMLQPQDRSHVFQMRGGPYDQAPIEFRLGSSGEVEAANVHQYSLEKRGSPPAGESGLTSYLVLPELVFDPEQVRAFEELWQRVAEAGNGAPIDYRLPYPRHEFLRYLTLNKELVYHGSNQPDIDIFKPFRKSYELMDATERGNLQAVYGTHDGIWSMFFAVFDRSKQGGSIRNGVLYFQNREGEPLTVYQFSIDRDLLPQRPWRDGMVYLLPREAFMRLELAPGVLSNEWASEAAVKPLARLAVKPEDFPFLDQVQGHDDTPLKRLEELSNEVYAAVRSSEPLDGGFRLELAWSPDISRVMEEYIDLQKKFVPRSTFTLQFEGNQGQVILEVKGPPAFIQVVGEKLAPK